ncbi:MAG: signal peptidase I [Thermoleophilaceae bacterium]
MTSEDRDLSIFLDEEPEGSRSSASPEEGGERGAKHAGRKSHGLPVWQESILLLVLAVLIAIVIKSFFVQAFYIPSASMEPGLQGGPGVAVDDRVLVEKPSYWGGGEPRRGDIVVFSDPGGWLTGEEDSQATGVVSKVLSRVGLVPTGGHLVKRVIGVAGDVIAVNNKGQITVNGHALDESSYARPAEHACGTADPGTCYGPMPNVKHWTAGPVPDGYLFVMGDNRNNSADSSYHLCTKNETECSDSPWVPVDDVVGKVVSLVWPAGRAHIIHRPADFEDVPAP